MKIKQREPKLKPKDYPELLQLADLIGDFIQYWGFKKVQGRIWACLFLLDEPLRTQQLVDLLGISGPLVSISMAELLKYGVVLEAEKGRNGALRYRANPEAGAVIAAVLRARELPLLLRIQASAAKLPPSARPAAGPIPSERVGQQPVRLSEEKAKLLRGWTQLALSFLHGGMELVEASLNLAP